MLTSTLSCPYCGKAAELVTGEVIYPHREDLAHLKFWACLPCDAYVGTHKNSEEAKPLGTLANKATRTARMRAHAAFDPIWKNGHMSRSNAYEIMAMALGYELSDCHISMMDEDEANNVTRYAKGVMKAYRQKKQRWRST